MVRVAIVPASRWPRVPAWAVLVTLAWGALVAVTVIVGRGAGALADDASVTCNFRRVTGVPCPTCGSTRAVLAAFDGDVPGALAWNPLVVAVGSVVAIVLAVRVGFRRAVRVTLTQAERRAAWIAAIVLFAANWAFVIWSHP